MVTYYKLIMISVFITQGIVLFAQKKTFGVLSYSLPKGWQQQQNEGGIQLSITDKKTGAYAIAVITNANASTASAIENFNNDWLKLVKGTVQVTDNPTLQAPTKENGWDVISGSADYTDGADTGTATLLTATGGGQFASVVLMTNSKQYQNQLLTLLNSLELTKVSKTANSTPSATAVPGSTNSVVGLWCYYTNESNGYYNGMPQLTGGYFRREYLFKTDGTYIFRAKDWSVYAKDILFIYETGSWKINGNQLIITPNKGIGEWWGKAASNRTSQWGVRKKTSDYKPEACTYTFELRYFSGVKETHLLLKSIKRTQRDRAGSGHSKAYESSYSPRALDKSLIDNPPGFKAMPENKPAASAANATTDNTITPSLTGKIEEEPSTEMDTGTGTTGNYNTGVFQQRNTYFIQMALTALLISTPIISAPAEQEDMVMKAFHI